MARNQTSAGGPATRTMARIYSSQGYFDQAARIYKILFEKNPDNLSLIDEAAAFEQKMRAEKEAGVEKLVPLFSRLLRLLVRYKYISADKPSQGEADESAPP